MIYCSEHFSIVLATGNWADGLHWLRYILYNTGALGHHRALRWGGVPPNSLRQDKHLRTRQEGQSPEDARPSSPLPVPLSSALSPRSPTQVPLLLLCLLPKNTCMSYLGYWWYQLHPGLLCPKCFVTPFPKVFWCQFSLEIILHVLTWNKLSASIFSIFQDPFKLVIRSI